MSGELGLSWEVLFQIVLKGPVWSQSWALFRTDQGLDWSQKFSEPKKTMDRDHKKSQKTSPNQFWWSWTKHFKKRFKPAKTPNIL